MSTETEAHITGDEFPTSTALSESPTSPMSPVDDVMDEFVDDSRPEVDQVAEFPDLDLEIDSSVAEAEQNQRNGVERTQVMLHKMRIESQEIDDRLLPSPPEDSSRTTPTTNRIARLLKSPSNDSSWIKETNNNDDAKTVEIVDEMASLHSPSINGHDEDDKLSDASRSSSAEVRLWGPPPPSKDFTDIETQCFRCHEKIYPNDATHGPLKGVFFHQKCFICCECNRRLNLTSYFHSREDMKDRRIFCGQHQPKIEGSGYGMDSLDFKGPKIETERVTANVFGGPQMAKGGTFDANALGISQYTKHAQRLGNPNSNIRGGPEASKSATIDYQSMGIRGVVDNYQRQSAPNANIRGGPDAAKSAKIDMDSMDMKAARVGPKRDYNINRNILGGPDAAKSSGIGTDSLAMKAVTRDPKNALTAGDTIVRGGVQAQKSANIGIDSLHIRACTDHRQKMEVSNRNVRGGPDASKSSGIDASSLSIKGIRDTAPTHSTTNRNIRGGPEASKSAKMDAEALGIKSALGAPRGEMGQNLRSKVAATPKGGAQGDDGESEEATSPTSQSAPEPEEDVQRGDVKNIRKMFEN